jgi:hypothetical protein
MTTLLLVDRRNPQCVVFEHGGARTRLATQLRSRQLDRALASGSSSDASSTLSLRARSLISVSGRAALARLIRRLVEDAHDPLNPLTPGVPFCRRKILTSAQLLEELADRLTSAGPVDARGVAQIRVLLTDSHGPVYERPGADDLEPALREAMKALEVTA